MIALARAVAIVVVQAFTAAPHVDLLVGERECYGGECELRVFELQIGALWYETRPINIGRARR